MMRLLQGALALVLIGGVMSLALRAAERQDNGVAAQLLATPPMELPNYLVQTKDPAFGTVFTRITKPGDLGEGVVCASTYCSHRYSSSQAWNSDQSLLLLTNGCGGMCFLDGRTYAPLFHRDRSTECEWHPRNPKLMICVHDQEISTWMPRADREEIQFASTDYAGLQFGPYKGNPSFDGTRIAVRATRKDGHQVVFAFDLKQRRKFADIDLAQIAGTNNACSISPLGTSILCFQTLKDGVEQAFIFTVDGALRQTWPEHHRPGHGDMTVDADGSEVYVGISKSDPDKYQVIKRRLSDGKVTPLMKYGEAQHASLRSLGMPGWVFLSYSGNPDQVARHPDWAPYARAVVALRIDGSGEVRPIVQTRNIPFDYWSETHASPSPDGSQVVWSSNWGVPGGPVYDFVAHLDWPRETSSNHTEVAANGAH